MSKSTRDPYPFRNLSQKISIGKERIELLESFGWYRNMTGGWTHPHGLDFMSQREIRSYTPSQLKYKLQHGSRSTLPPSLKNERKYLCGLKIDMG